MDRVDISTVVLTGPNGASATVPIIGFGETPSGSLKTAVASNGPLPVPIGAIGGPLPGVGPTTATLSNGQTVQLPANVGAGASNDLNVTPDPNSGNGRRRRRNRNRNLGDSTDGF